MIHIKTPQNKLSPLSQDKWMQSQQILSGPDPQCAIASRKTPQNIRKNSNKKALTN